MTRLTATSWPLTFKPTDQRVSWLLFVYEEYGIEAMWQAWLTILDPHDLFPNLRWITAPEAAEEKIVQESNPQPWPGRDAFDGVGFEVGGSSRFGRE